MILPRPFVALLAAALILLVPAFALAKPPSDWGSAPDSGPVYGERVVSFRSDIEILPDSALRVTETIRVNSEGREIRRGITRDFPTRYRGQGGRTVRVGFQVESVERDGRAEPWSRERIDNGVRLRIGDADVLLEDGQHTYVIRYRTTGQLRFGADVDELYWNVTGNGWIFPIDSAEARIRLPRAVGFRETNLYTGAEGSQGSNAAIVSQQPGEILVRTTAPLGVREGLTVSVTWEKGVVTAPPPPSAAEQWVADFGGLGAAALALAALGGFFYYAWKMAGRGPVPGTVVPLFAPPDGLSAAAVRYLRRMRYDNRVFAAAIVDSGVRGKIRLEEGEGGWFSKGTTTIHKTADHSDLPGPEAAMLGRLFMGGESIEMDKANHAAFRGAQSALQDGLADAYKGRLFLKNQGWAWVGVALLVAAMTFVGAVAMLGATDAPWEERLLPWLGLGLLLFAVGLGSQGGRKSAGGWAAMIFAGLAGIAGLLVLFGTIGIAANEGLVLPIFAPLLALPLVISAFWWMAAPTKEGRVVMDKIAGFERYLSITEEDRLEKLHPPEKTPELFERYLPYAIALGVENRWAGKFAAILAAASADPSRQGSQYGWYSGSHNVWSNPGMFATAVGATLASSAAAASTAPGSSSGSGGGGFSGGGGGGGGGGGW